MNQITDPGPRWTGETTIEKMLAIIDDDALADKVADACYNVELDEHVYPVTAIRRYRAAVRERMKEVAVL